MTDQNILLQENGYPNAPDIKARLIDAADQNLALRKLFYDACAHISSLEHRIVELSEARKDAERYQWLRTRLAGYDFEWGDPPRVCVLFEVGNDFRGSRDISGSIDAAMKDKP